MEYHCSYCSSVSKNEAHNQTSWCSSDIHYLHEIWSNQNHAKKVKKGKAVLVTGWEAHRVVRGRDSHIF
jgi:hypothetical protein